MNIKPRKRTEIFLRGFVFEVHLHYQYAEIISCQNKLIIND